QLPAPEAGDLKARRLHRDLVAAGFDVHQHISATFIRDGGPPGGSSRVGQRNCAVGDDSAGGIMDCADEGTESRLTQNGDCRADHAGAKTQISKLRHSSHPNEIALPEVSERTTSTSLSSNVRFEELLYV